MSKGFSIGDNLNSNWTLSFTFVETRYWLKTSEGSGYVWEGLIAWDFDVVSVLFRAFSIFCNKSGKSIDVYFFGVTITWWFAPTSGKLEWTFIRPVRDDDSNSVVSTLKTKFFNAIEVPVFIIISVSKLALNSAFVLYVDNFINFI